MADMPGVEGIATALMEATTYHVGCGHLRVHGRGSVGLAHGALAQAKEHGLLPLVPWFR